MIRQGHPLRAAGPAVKRQRGAALVLFVVGLVAILGVVGLALDGGHMFLSKSRLQNAVDAAALSAAKTLDETADEALADAAARATFTDNADTPGNRELYDAYQGGTLTITVEFSSTLNPFTPGTTPAEYVRVRAQNFRLPIWFSAVVGVDEKGVAASAVAGPSPTIRHACNLMPMMVCGNPTPDPDTFWGYETGDPDVLKSSTTNGDWEVGPGNFQLIRLGDGQGGAVVREGMAGNYDGCIAAGEPIQTEPGNTVGPVVQGFNTRFGSYAGPMAGQQDTYPPDLVTVQPSPPLQYDNETDTIMQGGAPVTDGGDIGFGGYADYTSRYSTNTYDEPDGSARRREIAVAIGDCSGTTSGQGEVPLLGFGCFFLYQEAEQKGNESFIYGEFLEDCNSGGLAGPEPTDVPGPYIIQLYRDYESNDS